MRTDAELRDELVAELGKLRSVVPEIHGCLVASTDGLLIAEDAQVVAVEGVAALSAACLGVSQRIADSAGHQEFEEVLIRSTGGYVGMYMVGNGAVLVTLASADANVGRLHHEARRATAAVSRVVEAAATTLAGDTTFAKELPRRGVPEPAPW